MKILSWLFGSKNKFEELEQSENEAIMDVLAMAVAMDSNVDRREIEEVNQTIKVLVWKGAQTIQDYLQRSVDEALATVEDFDRVYHAQTDGAVSGAEGAQDSEEPPADASAGAPSGFGIDWSGDALQGNDDWADTPQPEAQAQVDEMEPAKDVSAEVLLEGICNGFAQRLQTQWVREEYYYESARIIVADQEITERERLYLGSLVKAFEITPQRLKFITSKLLEESSF